VFWIYNKILRSRISILPYQHQVFKDIFRSYKNTIFKMEFHKYKSPRYNKRNFYLNLKMQISLILKKIWII